LRFRRFRRFLVIKDEGGNRMMNAGRDDPKSEGENQKADRALIFCAELSVFIGGYNHSDP